MISAAQQPVRHFDFERDTFAFANELVWQYRFDPRAGTTVTVRNNPPPTYSHRCFVLVRAARQFLYHARFEPGKPAPDEETCSRLIKSVVSRSARIPSVEADKICIPGYDSLRAFSQAREASLKTHCGGAWQSYVLRSHWRMVFPFTSGHQEAMARQLLLAFERRPDPIVHLVRFPQLTINHGITLFQCRETQDSIEFLAYDPNTPARPVSLVFDCHRKEFLFPRTFYWAGGPVNVMEVFRSWFF